MIRSGLMADHGPLNTRINIYIYIYICSFIISMDVFLDNKDPDMSFTSYRDEISRKLNG